MTAKSGNVVELRRASLGIGETATRRVTLLAIGEDGLLLVRDSQGCDFYCEYLEMAGAALVLSVGDSLLATAADAGCPGIVLGRIGRYREPTPQGKVTIEATETLSIKCGEAAIELRADGKLMVKGEDVLVKARGTQRIKAGSVNIN